MRPFGTKLPDVLHFREALPRSLIETLAPDGAEALGSVRPWCFDRSVDDPCSLQCLVEAPDRTMPDRTVPNHLERR
jgi:hypothetical protein